MWMVPFVVVTSLVTLVAFIALFSGAWVLALLASYVGGLIQLIVGLVVLYFLVQRSDSGPNLYGPPATVAHTRRPRESSRRGTTIGIPSNP